MLVDVDWCWLLLTDADWCWLILIDADWCWLVLIDSERTHVTWTIFLPLPFQEITIRPVAMSVPRISTVARAALCRIYSCCEGFQLRELIWPRSLFEQSEVRIRIGLKAVYPGSREDPGMNVGPAHLLDHRLDPWSVLKQNQHKKHHPVHLVKYNSIILATNICLVGSNSFDLTTKSVST